MSPIAPINPLLSGASALNKIDAPLLPKLPGVHLGGAAGPGPADGFGKMLDGLVASVDAKQTEAQALTQKVLTAEISKDQKIDVIVSDFGPSLVGALPLFKKFNKSIPALATSDGNSLGCLWTDVAKDNPDFKLFTVATGNDNVRLAVDWAVAKATGGTDPTDVIFKAPNFENSVTGTPSAVQCRKDLPGSIYLSAKMSGDDQAKAVNK